LQKRGGKAGAARRGGESENKRSTKKLKYFNNFNMSNENTTNGTKRKLKVYIPLGIVSLIVISGIIYWYSEYSKYISSDDAKIECDNVSISSKILGRVAKIYKDEEDSVKAGELLVELDSTDLVAQYKQALAARDQALANRIQVNAKFNFDKESMKVLVVNNEKNKEDFERGKNQFDNEVISKEQYDHFKKSLETSQAQLDASASQLQVSKAQVDVAEAAIATSQAQIGIIQAQLKNTKLYAPMDGIISKRWLLPGDIAQPGQSILNLSNTNKFWVTIYLEETKIEGIHLNQQAIFNIDAYPGTVFNGKIINIGSSTASQFSLIPANNASGNFTKVTQRIPFKISIDGTENKSPITNYIFYSGMSVVVKIIKDKK
jgi:membrane fusion protein, multidrug efflux system